VSEFGLVGEDHLLDEPVDQWPDDVRAIAASGVDLVFVTGGAWDAENINREFPNTKFVWPAPIDDGAPNSAYAFFAEQEGAYLAGVAAALTSQSGKIGFIGGYDDGFIWTWHAGYEAGARSIQPTIEILSAYLSYESGFHDAPAAEEEASRMFGAGADVVFHAAGDSGVGVIAAATALSTAEHQLWAIGVDSDQYVTVSAISGVVHPELWREHILTSVLKRVDVANYELLAEFARGDFRPGRHTFDLASGDVDISYSGGFIDDIRTQIEVARQQIISGQVTVPCMPPEKVELAIVRGYYSEDWCHS
jgi:basic membrane protein A